MLSRYVLVMVIGVLGLILVQGAAHFWPADLHTVQAKQADGSSKRLLAEEVRAEEVSAVVLRDSGMILEGNELVYQRQLLKLGNRDVYGRDFAWFLAKDLSDKQEPLDATVIERREWGNFYGFPLQLLEGDKVVAEGDAIWAELVKRIERSNEIHEAIKAYRKRRHWSSSIKVWKTYA